MSLCLDIYTLIVEQLAAFPPTPSSSLAALSLTCRSFRPLCQRHMFNNVDINAKLYTLPYRKHLVEGRKHMEDFIQLLNDSPHLADYIRNLQFSLIDYDVANPSFASQFLSKLHHICSFKLACQARAHPSLVSDNPASEKLPGFDWRTIDPDLAAALHGIIQSPDLQHLSIVGFNHFPPRVFSWKTSTLLVSLSIKYLSMDTTDTSARGDEDSSRPQIKELYIGKQCNQATKVLLGGPGGEHAVFDFSHVEKLSVEWSQRADIDTTKAIMQSACRIEDLQCGTSSAATLEGLAEMIMYGSSQTLRNLKFTRPPPEGGDNYPFRGLIEELKLLSGNVGVLESITVRLNLEYDMVDDVSDKCKMLDGLLSDNAAFPRLRQLAIDAEILALGSDLEDQELEDKWEYILKNCFTRVAAIPGFDLKFYVSIEF
ncbi:hypothetical protein BDZ97DRAFT_833483 [Flammula alnicola]|nr:hypothetical protein BDZ97DRAFT_833483 [Flammula alnicola]